MRISKNLRVDQENINRFLTALGGAAVILSSNKYARPNFFISAHTFIIEYIAEGFFKKEDVLIQTLVDGGFPQDEGPILAIRTDHQKCQEAADLLINSAKLWESGDEDARVEVGWATSVYTTALRLHLERLKNLIFPLLEQTVTIDDEHKISEGINGLVFEGNIRNGTEKYIKLIEQLEDELSDWR